MEKQTIEIPVIELEWSDWHQWAEVKKDARSAQGVRVPNRTPGVYEAKFSDSEERLNIGRTSNLRHRIKQGLVKGKSPHSSGERLRTAEDVSKIVIRWAVTDRPAAAEEELHRQHMAKFGRLPKYVQRT